jgi:hypothetical protein
MTAAATWRDEWRANLSDALAFWEPARVTYNVILLIITAGWLALAFDSGLSTLMFIPVGGWLALVVLAAIANLLYCAAYPVDLLLQFSTWRPQRAAWRAAVWLSGAVLAGSLASLIFWALAAPL